MIRLLIIIGMLAAFGVRGQKLEKEIPKPYKLEDYNFILATQCIGAKYKFTKDSYLIEQAKQIRGMGSNVLKVSMGKNYFNSYGMSKLEGLTSTLDLFQRQKDFKKAFDMDFKYYFMWVHTMTGVKFLKPMTPQDKQKVYDEMYEFASFLLKEYNKSGKTFMIGNWEGDWLLHGLGKRKVIPSDEKIQAMTDWFTLRQLAVDQAKKDVDHENVDLYHYVEVNLVEKGFAGEKCISESILSNVNPDLVSYSSYESIKKHENYDELKNHLANLMSYMENKLQPKEGISFERRVFIGEYGYNAPNFTMYEKQANSSREIMLASLELNLPFALHWEMYNNEYNAKGITKGMSLVSEKGEYKPIYDLHYNYYKTMNDYLKKQKQLYHEYPNQQEFNQKAVEVLKSL